MPMSIPTATPHSLARKNVLMAVPRRQWSLWVMSMSWERAPTIPTPPPSKQGVK